MGHLDNLVAIVTGAGSALKNAMSYVRQRMTSGRHRLSEDQILKTEAPTSDSREK